MTYGRLLAYGMLAIASACGGTGDAPPSFDTHAQPELLYLVHNEMFSIHLDGTDPTSLGLVGDNKLRTGWPRRLPDGRAIALGDDSGAIFPYYQATDHFVRLSDSNVSVSDSLCGVSLGGASRMIFTTTPFSSTRSLVSKLDVDAPSPVVLHEESDAYLSDPSPYDEGSVVAVRTTLTETQIVVIDVTEPDQSSLRVIAKVAAPWDAMAPARLPDGRVVFIRFDPRVEQDFPSGALWIIEDDGSVHDSGLDGLVNLVVLGDEVVYEAGGNDGIADLIVTNLVDAPMNVTNTPFVSEHLGWSD